MGYLKGLSKCEFGIREQAQGWRVTNDHGDEDPVGPQFEGDTGIRRGNVYRQDGAHGQE